VWAVDDADWPKLRVENNVKTAKNTTSNFHDGISSLDKGIFSDLFLPTKRVAIVFAIAVRVNVKRERA